MTTEGPPLELLLRRLAETPPDFLAAPRIGGRGQTHTAAVLQDVLRLHGAEAVDKRLPGLSSQPEENMQRLALLAGWLLADGAFLPLRLAPADLAGAILGSAEELAGFVKAYDTVADPERREELVRTVLAKLSLRPLGESEPFAHDRLTTLSTAERTRVLAASREAERRAREVREALVRRAAQEAADKSSRE